MDLPLAVRRRDSLARVGSPAGHDTLTGCLRRFKRVGFGERAASLVPRCTREFFESGPDAYCARTAQEPAFSGPCRLPAWLVAEISVS